MIVAEGDRDARRGRRRPLGREGDRVRTPAPTGIEGEDGPETTDEGNAVEAIEVGVTNVQGAEPLDARLHRPGDRRREPGHRHALDAQRALRTTTAAGTAARTADHNYNWHDCDPRADHERRRRHGVARRPTRAATTSSPRATTTATARTRPAPPSVRATRDRRRTTRSASRREPSGSAAATWTRATARPATYTRVLPVLHRADRPRPGRTPTRRSGRT